MNLLTVLTPVTPLTYSPPPLPPNDQQFEKSCALSLAHFTSKKSPDFPSRHEPELRQMGVLVSPPLCD